jgi:hypothetical protein
MSYVVVDRVDAGMITGRKTPDGRSRAGCRPWRRTTMRALSSQALRRTALRAAAERQRG